MSKLHYASTRIDILILSIFNRIHNHMNNCLTPLQWLPSHLADGDTIRYKIGFSYESGNIALYICYHGVHIQDLLQAFLISEASVWWCASWPMYLAEYCGRYRCRDKAALLRWYKRNFVIQGRILHETFTVRRALICQTRKVARMATPNGLCYHPTHGVTLVCMNRYSTISQYWNCIGS